MKTFLVVVKRNHEEQDVCFLAYGESIDDSEMKKQIAIDLTGYGDGNYGDILLGMDEDEAKEDSSCITIYEVASEHKGNEFFMDAWRYAKQQQKEWEDKRKAEQAQREKAEYERLKEKFGKEQA